MPAEGDSLLLLPLPLSRAPSPRLLLLPGPTSHTKEPTNWSLSSTSSAESSSSCCSSIGAGCNGGPAVGGSIDCRGRGGGHCRGGGGAGQGLGWGWGGGEAPLTPPRATHATTYHSPCPAPFTLSRTIHPVAHHSLAELHLLTTMIRLILPAEDNHPLLPNGPYEAAAAHSPDLRPRHRRWNVHQSCRRRNHRHSPPLGGPPRTRPPRTLSLHYYHRTASAVRA